MTTSEPLQDDGWSIAEGEENGKPLYIRFRDKFRGKAADAAYPRLIQIVWKYKADENGLPSLDEVPLMRALESQLVEAVESPNIGVLVAVCTNNGEREWMFYVSAVADFERCLNAVQEGQEEFPIDVTSARDPKWSAFYEETLGGLN